MSIASGSSTWSRQVIGKRLPACVRCQHDETYGGSAAPCPLWTARVLEAIQNAVPVGSVGYGPESIDAMAKLFSTQAPKNASNRWPTELPPYLDAAVSPRASQSSSTTRFRHP